MVLPMLTLIQDWRIACAAYTGELEALEMAKGLLSHDDATLATIARLKNCRLNLENLIAVQLAKSPAAV